MSTTIAATLTDAKNLLIEKGRTHTELVHPDTGCLCALGAIGVAVVGKDELVEKGYKLFESWSFLRNEEILEAVEAVAQELEKAGLNVEAFDEVAPFCHVYRYNDNRSTTDEDVLAVFDRAISRQ